MLSAIGDVFILAALVVYTFLDHRWKKAKFEPLAEQLKTKDERLHLKDEKVAVSYRQMLCMKLRRRPRLELVRAYS